MQVSDWINVVLCILSFLLALISVVTVLITLRQNHRMIENATRPYVSAKYETVAFPDGTERYIVVKNYGQTSAQILEMNCSGSAEQSHMDRVNKLNGFTLAPGQLIIYYFGKASPNAPEIITLFCRYRSIEGKEYQEKLTLQLSVGSRSRRCQDEAAIPFALQEITERLF